VFWALLVGDSRPAYGEVVRLEIRQRVPFAGGHSFGRSGPYEKLTGRLIVEVDPDGSANAGIHDLKLAPRNERGRVECWADFFLLKPVDPQRGNRRILYDVSNRGNKLALCAGTVSETRDLRRKGDRGGIGVVSGGILAGRRYGRHPDDRLRTPLVERPIIAREKGVNP
jgi:hypothetical protein